MPTYTLPTDSSPAELDQHLSFTTRRLGAYPETTTLFVQAKGALSLLRSVVLAERDAEETRLASRAALSVLVADLYDSASSLSRWVLATLNNDRKDARYTRAFPSPISDTLEGSISDAKVAYLEVALQHISAEPTFLSLSPHILDLQEKLNMVQTARDNHAQTITLERAAEATLKTTADETRDLFNTLHPQLVVLFPKRKGLVDSFFLSRQHRSTRSEPSEP